MSQAQLIMRGQHYRRKAVWNSLALAAVVAFALAVGGASASVPSTLPFGSTLVLAGADFTSRNPAVGSAADGHTVAVWTQIGGSSGMHAIEYSDLTSAGWSIPQKVFGSNDGEDPVIAVSPSGNVVIAWTVHNVLEVSIRLAGHSAFVPVQTLGSSAADTDTNNKPAVAINDAGTAVAVWQHTDSASNTDWIESSFARGGTTFDRTWPRLGTASASNVNNAVGIDTAGNAIAMFQETGVDTTEDTFQALAPAGAGFGTSTELDPNQTDDLSMSSNAKGDVVASWSAACPGAEPNCTEVFVTEAVTGSTTAGMSGLTRLSNPGDGDAAHAGVEAKIADGPYTGIDEHGNALVSWDTVNEPAGHSNQFAAWHAADAPWNDTQEIATIPNLSSFDHEQHVSVADGHALLTYRVQQTPTSQGSVVFVTGTTSGALGSVQTLSGAQDADSSISTLSPSGAATVLWRNGSTTNSINARTTMAITHQAAPPVLLVVPAKLVFSASGRAKSGTARCAGTFVSCRYAVTVRRHGTVVARGKATVAGDASAKIRLIMTSAGRRHIPKGRKTKVTVGITVTGPNGASRTLRIARLATRH